MDNEREKDEDIMAVIDLEVLLLHLCTASALTDYVCGIRFECNTLGLPFGQSVLWEYALNGFAVVDLALCFRPRV